MSEGGPTFSDEQSALILQRAAELQAKEGRGLSLRELEAAAAEAGIDVALVRRAAQEVAVAGPPAPPPVPVTGGALGAPLHLVHERVLPGAPRRGAWDDVLAEIRRQLGVAGRAEVSDRQLAWSDPHGRAVRVSIVARSDRTLVRVEERMSGAAGGLFLGMALPVALGGLGFILPICIAVLDLPVLIPVALVVWASLAFLLARTIFRTIARQRDAELRALADGLVEVCRETSPKPPPVEPPSWMDVVCPTPRRLTRRRATCGPRRPPRPPARAAAPGCRAGGW